MPDSNATITRTQLLQRAFRRIGIDSPSTNELALAVGVLNDVMKELDSEGRWLNGVSRSPHSLTLANGTASYQGGSGATYIPLYAMEIVRVEFVTGSAPYPELTGLSLEDWLNTSLRGTSGQPLTYHFERKTDSSASLLWFAPTPNASGTAYVWTRRRLYDFDNASDNPDIPQEWNQKLVKRMSYELAPEYGIPLTERQILKAEMDEAMRMGHAANAESATKRPPKGQYF